MMTGENAKIIFSCFLFVFYNKYVYVMLMIFNKNLKNP